MQVKGSSSVLQEWPGRISEVMKDAEVSFQWDYPYDDYFTYKGGLDEFF